MCKALILAQLAHCLSLITRRDAFCLGVITNSPGYHGPKWLVSACQVSGGIQDALALSDMPYY